MSIPWDLLLPEEMPISLPSLLRSADWETVTPGGTPRPGSAMAAFGPQRRELLSKRLAYLRSLVLVTLFCSACLVWGREFSAPPESRSAIKFPIVPGVSVGPISIGMPISEVLRLMGMPDRVLGYVGVASYRYQWLVVEADGTLPIDKQIVRSINTTSSLFKTYSGLAVGSAEADVRRVLGEPNCSTLVDGTLFMAYARGVSFMLNDSTREVTEIAVRPNFC
jgi:hypothetical protein